MVVIGLKWRSGSKQFLRKALKQQPGYETVQITFMCADNFRFGQYHHEMSIKNKLATGKGRDIGKFRNLLICATGYWAEVAESRRLPCAWADKFPGRDYATDRDFGVPARCVTRLLRR